MVLKALHSLYSWFRAVDHVRAKPRVQPAYSALQEASKTDGAGIPRTCPPFGQGSRFGRGSCCSWCGAWRHSHDQRSCPGFRRRSPDYALQSLSSRGSGPTSRWPDFVRPPSCPRRNCRLSWITLGGRPPSFLWEALDFAQATCTVHARQRHASGGRSDLAFSQSAKELVTQGDPFGHELCEERTLPCLKWKHDPQVRHGS